MRARVLLVVLTAVTVVGCGPKPAAPTGEPGSANVPDLDGIWVIEKIDAPNEMGERGTGLDALREMYVFTVQGERVTQHMKGLDDKKTRNAVFKVDTTKSPHVFTFVDTDSRWDTDPVGPIETRPVRPKATGIIRVEGDMAKLAFSHDGSLVPTGFVAKAPTKPADDANATPTEKATVLVMHLTRVKEAPEWATKPSATPNTGK